MKGLQVALAAALLVSSTFAGPFQLVYQRVVDGGEDYRHLSPVLDEAGQLIGYVAADSTNGRVVIHTMGSSRDVVAETGEELQKTLAFVDPEQDRWLIYLVYYRGGCFPHVVALGATTDSAWVINEHELDWPCTVYSPDIALYTDLFGVTDSTGALTGVQFSYVFSCRSYMPPGVIVDVEDHSTVFSPELDSVHWSHASTGIFDAPLSNPDRIGTVVVDNRYYYYQVHSSEPAEVSARIGVSLWDGSKGLGFISYQDRLAVSMLFGDFAPEHSGKELIITWRTVCTSSYDDPRWCDWLELDATSRAEGLCCIRIHPEGGLSELWCSGASLAFHYATKDQKNIVGINYKGSILSLDAATGQITDSVSLPHRLQAVSFFETGLTDWDLHVLARSYDTVFIYRLTTPTDVTEPELDALPSSIVLRQNYPNPFNGETVISFVNPRRQPLELAVFNVLGQRVATLHNEVTDPGELSVTWPARDQAGRQVASGVFLARLKSERESRVIKMTFVK
ncbi:MAG TPA: T9SS type A sorting domain-containing protein [Acidobacteriota bacterium]|nr:T9SS type A sorting domain-containing protein [Acidobacteriota bacterium]